MTPRRVIDRLRGRAKALRDEILTSALAGIVGSQRTKGGRLVLSYHNVVRAATRSGDVSLHLPLDQFKQQLDAVVESNLCAVRVDEPPGDDRTRPQIAVTFDDAYLGVLELALPELEARRIPATIFVAPGLLGKPAPWWDLLADPALGAVPGVVRHTALARLQGDGERIIRFAKELGWRLSTGEAAFRIATESDLQRSMESHPRLSLGAHTWSHLNLAALDPARLPGELVAPLRWLEDRWPARIVRWLAYPYGFESSAVRKAAAMAGYDGALRVAGGWYQRTPFDNYATPRFNVTPALSIKGFKAALAGYC